MAKTSIIQRELKREKLVKKFKKKRDALRAIIKDKDSTAEEKWKAQLGLQKLPRNSAPVRQMNRCQLTGRPRGVYRKFGLSRHKVREAGNRGDIPGMVKSSW